MRHTLVVLACLAPLGCASSAPPNPDSQRVGAVGIRPSDFTVETVDGKTFHLADHLGKEVIIVDFWLASCQPCAAELRQLDAIHKKHAARGLVVVAISIDPPDARAEVAEFVRAHPFSFPMAHDVTEKIGEAWDKTGVAPYEVLIGRDGRIIRVRDKYEAGDEVAMDRDVAEALSH